MSSSDLAQTCTLSRDSYSFSSFNTFVSISLSIVFNKYYFMKLMLLLIFLLDIAHIAHSLLCFSRTLWGWSQYHWALVIRGLYCDHVNPLLMMQQTASENSSGDIALIRRHFREWMTYCVDLMTAFWSSPSDVTRTMIRFVTSYSN